MKLTAEHKNHDSCIYLFGIISLLANNSETETPALDLHISITYGLVSSKIYDKCDDFDIVNFPFWMAMFHVVLFTEYKIRSSM